MRGAPIASLRRAWPDLAWFAALLALALGLRLAYLSQITGLGFYRQPLSDARIYDQRARQIAAGDWLGPPDFVHAPLYAYCLAAVYAVTGPDLAAARVVQSVVGAAACLIVAVAGRRWFNRRTGLLAGLLLAAYPPLIFFDGLIQKTTLTVLLSAGLVWWLAPRPTGVGSSRAASTDASRVSRRPELASGGWWHWGLAGFMLGLLIMNRQNALALIPLLLAWLWWGPARPGLLRGSTWCLAVFLGLAAALLPWVVRNWVVLGEPVLTTPNLGQNFAMGNHPAATGTYLPARRGRATAEFEQDEWRQAAEQAVGRELTAGEVSAYYLAAARAYIRDNPAAWFRLLLRKTWLVFNAYEAPDTEDYYLYSERSSILRWLDGPWHFGVLAPLSAAGIVLTWRQRGRTWFLLAWLVITAAGVALFVVFARYRVPLIPVLVLFAAAGLDDLLARVRQRQWRGLLVAGLICAAGVPLCNWPILGSRRPVANSYSNHAVALAEGGRRVEALAELDRALALNPADVDAHYLRGSVLEDLGRWEEAEAQYRQALAGDPIYGGAHCGLGRVYLARNELDPAEKCFREALQYDSADAVALNGLGVVLGRRGQLAEAEEALTRALHHRPTYAEAYLNRGNLRLAAGKWAAAAREYSTALEYRPDWADAWHNLGVARVQAGDLAGAESAWGTASRIDPRRRDTQQALLALLAQAGCPEAAILWVRKWLEVDPERADLREALQRLEAESPGDQTR